MPCGIGLFPSAPKGVREMESETNLDSIAKTDRITWGQKLRRMDSQRREGYYRKD